MTSTDNKVKFYRILDMDNKLSLWGMSPAERIRKQFKKLKAEITEAKDLPGGKQVLLLRGDVVYDTTVLKGLLEQDNVLLESDVPLAACVNEKFADETKSWLEGGTKPDIKTLKPEDVGESYNHMLRKREAPACYELTKDNTRDIEWGLFKASYKGVTDFVTKYWWPVPAFHVTRLCAHLKLTPNMVTSVGAILMFLALWLFLQGQYGWGLAAAWIMTFLDTVDGKLARVTFTSSKWGNIFDHGIDLLHPPFWYIAWGYGLDNAGHILPAWLVPGLWAMFITYVLGRLCEGYFVRRYGFHIHVWRPFDSFFRLIVARRNPNMVLLTLFWLIGQPAFGLLLVILWHIMAVVVHTVQIFQAEQNRIKGERPVSWLAHPV